MALAQVQEGKCSVIFKELAIGSLIMLQYVANTICTFVSLCFDFVWFSSPQPQLILPLFFLFRGMGSKSQVEDWEVNEIRVHYVKLLNNK